LRALLRLSTLFFRRSVELRIARTSRSLLSCASRGFKFVVFSASKKLVAFFSILAKEAENVVNRQKVQETGARGRSGVSSLLQLPSRAAFCRFAGKFKSSPAFQKQRALEIQAFQLSSKSAKENRMI